MRKIRVPLDSRSYDILVGGKLFSQLGQRCRQLRLGSRCVVVTDSVVGPRYGKRALRALKGAGFDAALHSVPAGESSKSLKQVQAGYDHLAKLRLERGSFVVALGGGVVGDLAGFLAMSYLRGIDFVQVPTTLLAQVDSSVGGKVGVNLKAGKNLVGAFYQPRLVLCDLDVLKSLPPREFRAGMAEVIKYGIIYDARLFSLIEREHPKIMQQDRRLLARIIARSCQIKADVVAQDEKERGLRAILNFGHTIGHALESITRYGEYLHGEAISIGQVAAAMLSARQLGLDPVAVERIRGLFGSIGLPVTVSLSGQQERKLFEAMRLDKKVSGGKVQFVLAKQIGQVRTGQSVDDQMIRSVLAALGE
ncbi:MAG: 3-dehydroquinate synthase [Verrucomicrobia subdivision 3 bacterium]|nr:3-dehydroquinate synthase [Limisphaerales bacterium]MCS1414369.1 3-dehydroquinate synthase [Limisphaerales bacterium]